MNSVRELRHRMGMTQAAFAEFCDISIVSVARYEAGGKISLRSAERIASACHVSVDFVLHQELESGYVLKEGSVFALTLEEQDLIDGYRSLSKKGKRRMRETLEEMLKLYRPSEK